MQSRCAILVAHAVAGARGNPLAVRRKSGGCGTCSVWYGDELACTIEWIAGDTDAEHVIQVFWEPTWAYLGTVAS